MTLYCYMYRSWQDCCRRGENRSWPSVSVESVDSEYGCLNNAIVYAFIMRLTAEERAYGPLLSWTLCISEYMIFHLYFYSMFRWKVKDCLVMQTSSLVNMIIRIHLNHLLLKKRLRFWRHLWQKRQQIGHTSVFFQPLLYFLALQVFLTQWISKIYKLYWTFTKSCFWVN